MDIVGNIAEDIININYKAIVEALIEVHSEIIAKRNPMSVRS